MVIATAGASGGGFGVPLDAIHRRVLQVSVEDADVTTRFGMRSPAMGQAMAFEILKSDYARDFARLLQQPAPGRG